MAVAEKDDERQRLGKALKVRHRQGRPMQSEGTEELCGEEYCGEVQRPVKALNGPKEISLGREQQNLVLRRRTTVVISDGTVGQCWVKA